MGIVESSNILTTPVVKRNGHETQPCQSLHLRDAQRERDGSQFSRILEQASFESGQRMACKTWCCQVFIGGRNSMEHVLSRMRQLTSAVSYTLMVARRSEGEHKSRSRCGIRVLRRRGGAVDERREMFSECQRWYAAAVVYCKSLSCLLLADTLPDRSILRDCCET